MTSIKDEADIEDMDSASREMADVLDRNEIDSSTQYPSSRTKNSRLSERDLSSLDLKVRMVVRASEQGYNLDGTK